MNLSTDDDIYRVRLVWLGPPGYTLPFQLPYAQYGLFVTLLAAFTAVAVLVTGDWMSVGMSIAAAVFATSYIWRHVDPDRPARKVLWVALTDWAPVKPRTKADLPRLSGAHIRISPTITEHR